jgi:rhodanese-related sulfurtransferase
MSAVKNISPAEAFALTKKGALIVDVREHGEIERMSFDVPDVMAMPLSRFSNSFREIPQKQKVIVACRSGHRSASAASMLVNQGYKNIMNLQYGMMGWEHAGLPVKKQPTQSPLAWLQHLIRKQP